MLIGTIQFRLHFPMPQSLKEKRSILKSVLSRIKNKFNVAVSEIDGMDLWQIAVIAVVAVNRERKEVEKTLDEVHKFLAKEEGLEISDFQKEIL